MKRVMLVVAYDGRDFAGFQAQKSGVRTVEGVLNQTLSEMTGEEITVTGSSRTDAGVHARCNLAVFDTESQIPADRFSHALNIRLPEDLKIQESFEVPADFHPRRCRTVKTYEYRIYNAPFPSPVYGRYAAFSYTPFDVERMAEAGRYLVGEHDFTSFSSVYSKALSHVRTITDLQVWEEPCGAPIHMRDYFPEREGEEKTSATRKRPDPAGDAARARMPRMIVIRVSGTGFLYNMVRIIAGTLMEAGRGALRPEDMEKILDARERTKAGPTAPACGLLLADYQIFPDQKKEAFVLPEGETGEETADRNPADEKNKIRD
ncbi:MAG: tRNA pseudouridine(38-40) synthase TruA [Lachnospiraceae bacterium]|nr:tRNA pseudouridine(38-40) synthase TruA [Lachnospiraceae bacterium]